MTRMIDSVVYECDTCGAEAETGGEYTERTFEDEGWYLGSPILCPEHNLDSESEEDQ